MRHKASMFLISTVVFAFALAQYDDNNIYLSNETPVTWSPTASQTVTVTTDPGYKIGVNVTKCNLDGERNEFARIRNGGDENDLSNDVLFSYSLSSNLSFLYNIEELNVQFSGVTPDSFTAIFTRVGTVSTTDEPPTTPIILPTASPEDSSTITVFLYGSPPEDFQNGTAFQKEFRSAVAAMAAEYCTTENIILNQTITADNVILNDVDMCPLAWRQPLCTRVIFEVPVTVDPDAASTWTGYQLNSDHLRLMWDRLAGKYIAPLGLSDDAGPDFDNMITWRVAVFSAVLVVIVLLLLIAKACTSRFLYRRNKATSDTVNIIPETRYSQTSMDPHYLQETPPLFESSFPMHNPERDSAIYTESIYSSYGDYGSLGKNDRRIPISQIDEDGNELRGETET